MHDYNTIVDVISLRNDKVSYPVIRQRYGIGNSGIDLIMNRYKESGLPWKDFLKLEPSQIEELIYPPKNIRKNDIPTGAGKSYISNALCIAAIRQFKTVKYIRANTMMSKMDQSRIKGTYLDYVNHMSRLDMLVIDNFGLMDLDLDKCRDFFEVIDSRDNQKSTIIVSQLPVKSWYDLFADNTYANACLDRIIHKAFRLELNGKNMRNPV